MYTKALHQKLKDIGIVADHCHAAMHIELVYITVLKLAYRTYQMAVGLIAYKGL
jgi:hypothetical protein